MEAELFSFFELLALSGLLFAQPVLDSLRRNAGDWIVARNASSFQIIVTVLVIVLGPALVLWAIEAIVGLISAPARRLVHAFFLGGLAAAFVFGIARRGDVGVVIAFVLAAAAGVALGALVLYFSVIRTYLRFLAIAPVVFAILFFTSPAISPLISNSSGPGAVHVKVTKPQRVMMIVLDEFPTRSLLGGSGAVDARLFPNFAALAGQSSWYRNTTSVAPYTSVAVPAIADGRYPQHPNAFPNSNDYPDTIFTLLGDSFHLDVHEASNENLCPRSLCPRSATSNVVPGILGDVTENWKLQAVGSEKAHPCACDDEDVVNGAPAAKKFVAGLKRSTGPELDYVHLILPHAPWHLLPSDQDYAPKTFVPQGLADDGTWSSLPGADLDHQRHLLQVQWADRWLGQVVARLKQLGEYDSTSIVVTADHGVTFDGLVPYRIPVQTSFSDILWVPLMIKRAGQTAPVVDDRPASTIDVLPTVADLVGVKVPWSIDGRSVFGEPRSSPDPRFLDWPSRTPYIPPTEAKFTAWDGVAGFRKVMATPAFNPGAPSDLAFYGSGPSASLVGSAAQPLVDPVAGTNAVSITDQDVYRRLDPTAHLIPWANFQATMPGVHDGYVAIVANGVIAAVVPTSAGFGGTTFIRAVLPPSLFRKGANDVKVYEIRGTPNAPRLVSTVLS